MSHPLVLVRAEIKNWERDFASRHGRDPVLQDIRDNPSIAEKYKLYKKLSKAAANTATPSRSHSHLPVPKSRPAESVPFLPGFNPFSPVKKTAKHNHTVPPTSPHPNPFATPAKNNSKPCPRTATPSPDPFRSIRSPSQNATASSSRVYPVSTIAISRARKRLRGEPVSPSPHKPKRQRIHSEAPRPIPKLDHNTSNSEHEPDQKFPQCNINSFFVTDSPVKVPASGKSFKLLFDDALPALSIAKPIGSSLAHLDSPHASFSQLASVDQYTCTQGRTSAQIFPTNDRSSAPSPKPTIKAVVPEVSQPRASVKRALDSGDFLLEHIELGIPLQPQYPLVPPSPPPQDSINRGAGKGKAKSTVSRKKPRVEVEESDEAMDSSDNITLKIANVSVGRGKHSQHADDLDWDSLLHLGTRNRDPAATEQIDANHHASGTFSVDLPDKFRRVLAISPSQCQDVTEERVVRGLLYGDRVGHYDPSRGGDVWDAGETDEGAQGDIETEDDWEGEPVPWEVGEL